MRAMLFRWADIILLATVSWVIVAALAPWDWTYSKSFARYIGQLPSYLAVASLILICSGFGVVLRYLQVIRLERLRHAISELRYPSVLFAGVVGLGTFVAIDGTVLGFLEYEQQPNFAAPATWIWTVATFLTSLVLVCCGSYASSLLHGSFKKSFDPSAQFHELIAPIATFSKRSPKQRDDIRILLNCLTPEQPLNISCFS